MNKVLLSDFIDKTGDGIHGTPSYAENGTYYFINGNNLRNGRIVIDTDTLMISDDEFENIKRPLNENTILISINGTIGNLAYYNGEKIALGKSACYINVKSTENKYFIHYILSTKEFHKYALQVAHGSTIKNLAPSQIAEYSFLAPSASNRDKIANVLKSLDDKIDNNTSIMDELEAMAKTLYDYWFVQFDFPDENGKPYRTAGGEMVWNDQLKREIPKEWKSGTVDTLLKIDNKSVDPQKLGSDIMEHYSIPAFDEGQMPTYEAANTIESGKYVVYSDCILTSKLNPQFKRLWDPFCDTDNAICSTEFIVYRPRNIWSRPYCYAILNSDEFYYHMVGKAISSTGSRKRIQPDVSASFPISIADDATIKSFNAIYGPIMEKQKELRKENRELTKLRDWLLPILMNGQATVK